jgi:hypothetical protein
MHKFTGLTVLVFMLGCGGMNDGSKNLRNRVNSDSTFESVALVKAQDTSIRSCRESGLGTTGIPQESGKSLCFNSDYAAEIKSNELTNLVSDDLASGYFRNSIVAFCKQADKGGLAVVQESFEDGTLVLTCTKSTVFHFENTRYQDLLNLSDSLSVEPCLGSIFDLTSTKCNALASSFCTSKGFQGGYLSGTYGKVGVDIQCLNGQVIEDDK